MNSEIEITVQNYIMSVFTGKISVYGCCFLDQLRKPEIIHAEFPSKTTLEMNSITLVQFTPLTKLKRLLLTQDFYFPLDWTLQKNWRIQETV